MTLSPPKPVRCLPAGRRARQAAYRAVRGSSRGRSFPCSITVASFFPLCPAKLAAARSFNTPPPDTRPRRRRSRWDGCRAASNAQASRRSTPETRRARRRPRTAATAACFAAAALLCSTAGRLPEPGIGSTARAADAQCESGLSNRQDWRDPGPSRPWDIDGERDRRSPRSRHGRRPGLPTGATETWTGTGTPTPAIRTSTVTAPSMVVIGDADGDGRRNTRDRDVDGDRHGNLRDWDIDGDRVENAFDPDSDASGDARYGAGNTTGRLPPGFLGVVSDYAFWDVGPTPARALHARHHRRDGRRPRPPGLRLVDHRAEARRLPLRPTRPFRRGRHRVRADGHADPHAAAPVSRAPF